MAERLARVTIQGVCAWCAKNEREIYNGVWGALLLLYHM